MARVTIEDSLKHVKNRFELVLLAAKRARDLALSGIKPEVPWDDDKPVVVALREIACGKITSDYLHQHVTPTATPEYPLDDNDANTEEDFNAALIEALAATVDNTES